MKLRPHVTMAVNSKGGASAGILKELFEVSAEYARQECDLADDQASDINLLLEDCLFAAETLMYAIRETVDLGYAPRKEIRTLLIGLATVALRGARTLRP